MVPSRMLVILLAAVSAAAPAWSGEARNDSPAQRTADRNCAWCHGPSAQGFTTAPRLAGQTAPYIEKQLLNFKNHARDNPYSEQYMWGAVPPVDPELARALAVYFSALEAQAASDGNAAMTERGRVVYFEGVPSANIPACAACHGPNAEGAGLIPRLGGLSYAYLKRRMQQWAQGYHASAMAPMPEVARTLPDQEIEAVASFLSFAE